MSKGLLSFLLIKSSCDTETNRASFDIELTTFSPLPRWVTGRHFHRSYSPNGTTFMTTRTGQNTGRLVYLGTEASRQASTLMNFLPPYHA